MSIVRSVILAGFALLVFSVSATAGDFATLNFIGFSKDGRYLAFEEYGTQDGSGFPYSNIYFVDVQKNSYAAKGISVRLDSETATERQARAKAKLNAAATLRKLRILDRNTGTAVVSRLLTDVSANHFLSEDPEKDQKINFAAEIGSMYRRGDYDLVMKSVKADKKGCDYLDEDQKTFMLELSLYDRERQKTIMLQKDTSLPASRACPLNYAVQHVYLYEDSIAVFLNTYHMGFEGPDMRYMVVTARLQ